MTPLFILTLWLFIGICTFVYLLIINEVMLSYFHLIFITLSGPITPLFILWMKVIEKLEKFFNPTDLREPKIESLSINRPKSKYWMWMRSIGYIIAAILILCGLFFMFFTGSNSGIPIFLWGFLIFVISTWI